MKARQIEITIDKITVTIVLNNSETANLLWDSLPLESLEKGSPETGVVHPALETRLYPILMCRRLEVEYGVPRAVPTLNEQSTH